MTENYENVERVPGETICLTVFFGVPALQVQFACDCLMFAPMFNSIHRNNVDYSFLQILGSGLG